MPFVQVIVQGTVGENEITVVSVLKNLKSSQKFKKIFIFNLPSPENSEFIGLVFQFRTDQALAGLSKN